MPLSDTHRDMLRFSRLVFAYPGERERQIRERFGLSVVQFNQQLNRLLSDPAALEADPHEVRRLQRIRATRRRTRGLSS